MSSSFLIASVVAEQGASAAPLTGSTQLISTGSLMGHVGNAAPTLSMNGRYVEFIADDLHVYRQDRVANTTVMVDVTPAGAAANNQTDVASMSPDGNWISFESRASDLVGGTNGQPSGGSLAGGVYLRNMTTGQTQRIDTSASGVVANARPDWSVATSANGSFVVFTSAATNLAPGNTGGQYNVYRKDVSTGQVALISSSSQATGPDGYSGSGQISADGNTILFVSTATNLVTGPVTTDAPYLWTSSTGVMSLPSYYLNGTTYLPNNHGELSGNGNVVAYYAVGSTNANSWQWLIYNRTSNSISPFPQSGASGELSYDGSKLAYEQSAPLAPESPPWPYMTEIYITDLVSGNTRMVSVNNQDVAANQATGNYSPCCVISGDGSSVAFTSDATNLGAQTSNAYFNLYVRGPSAALTGRRYVALGDSVPYGHGLANPGTDVQNGLPSDQPPSSLAYPSLVAGNLGLAMQVRSTGCFLTGDQLAVSGAPASAFNASATDADCSLSAPHKSVQVEEAGAANLTLDPPYLATIQAGADDINFADCLKYDLMSHATGTACVVKNKPTATVTAALVNAKAALVAKIQELQLVGTPHIGLVNYYQPVPTPAAISLLQFSSDNLVCLALQHNATSTYSDSKVLLAAINGMMKQVAIQTGVTLINIAGVFKGHEMCTTNPDVFSGDNGNVGITGIWWRAAHPTQAGQAAIALRVDRAFKGI